MSDLGAGWAALLTQGIALGAQASAVGLQIEEAKADYVSAIGEVAAQSVGIGMEMRQRIAASKAEGVLGLKEQASQATYESRMAMTQAEMIRSSVENKLGASGVRQTGSPLLAAQQNVDLAYATAERTIERGSAGVTLGGVRLKNTLEQINLKGTLLTSEYSRKAAELERKRQELAAYGPYMIGLALAGGLPGLLGSFYKLSDVYKQANNDNPFDISATAQGFV